MRPTPKCTIVRHHLLLKSPKDWTLENCQARGLSRASYMFGMDLLSNDRVTHAVIAKDRDRIVGWFRFTLVNETLSAKGTWVDKDYRKQGLGKLLWQRGIGSVKPAKVRVDTISPEGRELVQSVMNDSNEINWSLLG